MIRILSIKISSLSKILAISPECLVMIFKIGTLKFEFSNAPEIRFLSISFSRLFNFKLENSERISRDSLTASSTSSL